MVRKKGERTLTKWPTCGATRWVWTFPVPGSTHVQVMLVRVMLPPQTSGSSS